MALSDLEASQRNDGGIATAIGILKQRFGDQLQTNKSLREQHSHTTTYIPSQLPDAVVFPNSTEEVQEIVRTCAEYKVPIIPLGTGTSLEGAVNAPAGGISIDMMRMNKILKVNAEDLDVTLQPGVVRSELNIHCDLILRRDIFIAIAGYLLSCWFIHNYQVGITDQCLRNADTLFHAT